MKLVIIESPPKTCTKCAATKAVDEFVRDRSRRDGRHPQCEVCVRKYQSAWSQIPQNKEHVRHYQREFAKTPTRVAQIKSYQCQGVGVLDLNKRQAMKMKKRWGLSPNDYAAMLIKQNSCCATCDFIFKRRTDVQVDHCHATGVVRGLLCANCNRALGMVKDSIVRLQKLIDYLGVTP
jgi:hypothetical protein